MFHSTRFLCFLSLALLLSLLAACSAAPGRPVQTTTQPQPGGERPGPTGNELLVYQVGGGIEGLCDKLTVFKDGHATLAAECRKTSKDFQVDPQKLQQVQALTTELGALQFKTPDKGGADMMSVQLEVFGADKGVTPDQAKLDQLLALLSEVHSLARTAK